MTTHRPAVRARSLRSSVGQTTTEYLMIMGLITSVFIAVNNTMYTPFHLMMQNLLQCIADGTVNQTACGGVSSSSGSVAAPGVGGMGGLFNRLNGILNQLTGSISNVLSPPRPSGGGGPGGGEASSSQAVPMVGSLVQGVNVSASTERFTEPNGSTLETTRLCTTDIGALNTHRRTAGAAFVVVDIESEERPVINGGIRVPISEVAPGRWRTQLQVTGDELLGDSYCVTVRNPNGPATVTNVRFTSGLEPQ